MPESLVDIPVAEGTYSPDNYEAALCTLPDGKTLWATWAAYGQDGSRAFARQFIAEKPGPILPLSTTPKMQTHPIALSEDERTRFVWLEKENRTYTILHRQYIHNDFTQSETLHTLPESTKPWSLHALCDTHSALWICWAQSSLKGSQIEVLHILPGGKTQRFSISAGTPYNYRPRICESNHGVYLIWDAYVQQTYSVYGCSISPDGPSSPVRISTHENWENKSALCHDPEGNLWVAWVHCQDVMYNNSTIQQKYSIHGARKHGDTWHPLSGPNGSSELAPLHYGLLTDFPNPPNLGHMGRRLYPMLKSTEDGAIWLLYEAKADETKGTLASTGRLIGHQCANDIWSEPHSLAEGRVFYELPHDNNLNEKLYVLCQNIVTDELHLGKTHLSTSAPVVPKQKRTVNTTQWESIHLPFGKPSNNRAQNELPGEDSGRYRLFWADLHCHSAASIEMEGEPDELGHFARDKAQIDALTVSDNDCFWNRFTRQNVRHLKDYEFDYVKGNAMVLNEPGQFAMFPGYEMTITDQVDSGRDHRSVMSDDDEMEMDLLHFHYEDAYLRGELDTQKDTKACIEWFRKKKYLPLPHPHHGKYNLYDTEVEWGVDIFAAWMLNIELFDIYYKYLNQGHKFAFTASGDSHHRNPGLSGALTGIWAKNLDRASLLDAIRNRRCYGTAGQKILIEFTLDDHIMGSNLTVSADPKLKWRIAGTPDQDYILRIHRDGRLMHDVHFTENTTGEWEEYMLCRYRPGKHYYQLEVRTREPVPQYPANVAHALGERAWSTPIWVETVV